MVMVYLNLGGAIVREDRITPLSESIRGGECKSADVPWRGGGRVAADGHTSSPERTTMWEDSTDVEN